MENFYLSALVDELRPLLASQVLRRLSLHGATLHLDFHLADRRVLRAALEPATAALYLTHPASAKDAKSNEAHPFVAVLRKHLLDARLLAILKPPTERLVRLNFETFAVGGERARAALVFYFTGRSTNACLLNAQDRVEAVFRLRGTPVIGEALPMPPMTFDWQQLLDELSAPLTAQEILDRYFRGATLFGPLLEREFLARCQNAQPTAALTSLIEDLTQHEPQPAIYSRLPLEELGRQPLNLKREFLLSHIPLTQASELRRFRFSQLSEAADEYYRRREKAARFQEQFAALQKLVSDECRKRQALLVAIQSDREKFAQPERFKRYGDLLLANLSTAEVNDGNARVIDYFAEAQPQIDIEIGDGRSLQQAANDYFAQYQKARRALEAIAVREAAIGKQVAALTTLESEFAAEDAAGRLVELKKRAEHLLGLEKKAAKPSARQTNKGKSGAAKPVGRWFRSASGYEIVVGRNDKDNDTITFRLAASQDIWLHAADYPGSHVIIRNPSRREVPMQVVQEAAELAAFHSQAKAQDKVAVHYTQKKFISKPPRSKPGLVRLSSFKTLLVKPQNRLERIEKA